MTAQAESRVDLPGGSSASRVLHRALVEARDRFPTDLGPAGIPDDGRAFRRAFADVIPRVEAARAASPRRQEIARDVLARLARSILLVADEREIPLAEAMTEPAGPLHLQSVDRRAGDRLRPSVIVDGRPLAGAELRRWLVDLVARDAASPGVIGSIDWLLSHAVDEAGLLDLRGRRIALLGAGAELSPAPLWLEAGAEVLWLDVVPPPDWMIGRAAGTGRLHWAPGGADLVARPREIAATVEAFATGGPVDLGLYAYAPGGGREWRLAASMNAIVEALPAEAIRTVTMLVSPTSPAILTAHDLQAQTLREAVAPGWQRLLKRTGALGSGGGHASVEGVAVSRSVVTMQGASYQLAQYAGKLLTAETWATWGPVGGSGPSPLRVSANVAGVTRTRSMSHPLFQAAFAGAAAFGIETFDPATTRALSALLALRDWLDPEAPGAADDPSTRATGLLTHARVHGGLYATPYPIDAALRVAAALGAGRSPGQLVSLLRRERSDR